MPARTPIGKIPYPASSDRVADYPAIAKELAEKIERVYLSRQQGRVSLGTYQPGETYESTVTFPRPFRKPPTIAIGCANQRIRLAVYKITEKQFTYYAWNDTGGASSATASFDWIATTDGLTD